MFKEMMQTLFEVHGEQVVIHKNYGTDNQISVEFEAMQSHDEGKPERKYFEFMDMVDIQEGDVIWQQITGTFWVVTETEHQTAGKEYVDFKAYVEKRGNGKPKNLPTNAQQVTHIIGNSNVIIAGNVSNSQIVIGNNNVLQEKLNELLKTAEDDVTIQTEELQEIRECVKEIELSVKSGFKPKSASEKLLQLTSKFASIASLGVSIGKWLTEIK